MRAARTAVIAVTLFLSASTVVVFAFPHSTFLGSSNTRLVPRSPTFTFCRTLRGGARQCRQGSPGGPTLASPHRRPSRPFAGIHLASAGDENIANGEIPMIVSLIGATTSTLVFSTVYAALIWQRNALMVTFSMAAISNAILSKVLKKVIQQTRPPDLDRAAMDVKPSDGGMPSSHGMSLGFICTFTALHVGSWIFIPSWIYATISLSYRVQVKLHTWEQVVVGYVVGSSNAWLYHTFFESPMNAWVTENLLNEQGLLPTPLLIVPGIAGMMIVFSVERRLAQWLAKRKKEKELPI